MTKHELYISEDLSCLALPTGKYGQDVSLGWDPGVKVYRRMDGAWVAWLRKFHSGTSEAAAELGPIIKLFNKKMSSLKLSIPTGYVPPTETYDTQISSVL